MPFTPEQIIDAAWGPPKKEGQKKLEDFKKQNIPKPERVKSVEAPENSLGYEQIQEWLTKNNLEDKLEGGNLEILIKKQEEFYQTFYGENFTIDRDNIFLEESRLPAVRKALETGTVNYPLFLATPENLTAEEEQMTETEYFYHKIMEPLKQEGMKIWAETGTDRWTKLTLEEWLQRAIPVEVSDFNPADLENDWQKEIARVIDKKQNPPKIQNNKLSLIFTDNRQDIPKDQKPVNTEGEEVENSYSFIEMIKNKVNVLTPAQWIILASQLYQKDKTYLSRNTWDWLMAVVDHRDKKNNPSVSAALADSGDAVVGLYSDAAVYSDAFRRWRATL